MTVCMLCSGFGELALLYSAPRAATVEATSACRLWVMERAVYNSIKQEHAAAESTEKLTLIDSLPLLKLLRLVNLWLLLPILVQSTSDKPCSKHFR